MMTLPFQRYFVTAKIVHGQPFFKKKLICLIINWLVSHDKFYTQSDRQYLTKIVPFFDRFYADGGAKLIRSCDFIASGVI